MNEPFAFDVAYDYIAQKLLAEGLPKDRILTPSGTILFLENAKVYRATAVPIAPAFDTEEGKIHLGQTISNWVRMPQETPTKDFCMVVAVESYMQFSDVVDADTSLEAVRKARAQLPDSLAGHPDSVEVVGITVHHRSGIRIGALLINKDRSLTYQPLYNTNKTFGRLTPSAASSGR